MKNTILRLNDAFQVSMNLLTFANSFDESLLSNIFLAMCIYIYVPNIYNNINS